MSQHVLAANIVKCTISAISLAASSTIVHTIRHSTRGLKSPYSRIIFGLSIGDIIQSSGTLIGPFAAPRSTPDSLMAMGNTQTCDSAGFILIAGVLSSLLYLLFLVYFFWRRVKHQVSRQKFAYGEERYFHVLVWLLAMTMSSIVLVQKGFNPTKAGTICIITSYPVGCGGGDKDDENFVECSRGQSAPQLGRIIGAVLLVSLSCLFLLLGSITCHVYAIEKSLSASIKKTQLQKADDKKEQGLFEEDTNKTTDQNIREKPKEKESLTKNSLKQSLLYIFSFILTSVAPFAFFAIPKIADSKFGPVVLWLTSTLSPSYGIFLILTYTRPKVQILSKMFPKASWFLCFKVVLGSGGDIPPAHELKPSHLPQMSMEMREAPESPPFGSDLALSMSEEVSYEEMKSSMMAVSQSECWMIESQDDDIYIPNTIHTI